MLVNPTDTGVTTTLKGLAGGASNNNIRVLDLLVVPTVAMGFSVDISSYGFTTISNVLVIAERDTTDPMLVPNVAIKSKSTSAIVINITQGNNATVAILGINVLSGSPVIAATNLTTITLHVRVEGT